MTSLLTIISHTPILLLTLICIAAYYMLAPLKIWLTFRQRVTGEYVLIEREQLPDYVRQHFDSAAPALAAEGFSLIVMVQRKGMVANVTSYSAWWQNRDRGQSANCVVIVSPIVRRLYVSFETIAVPLFLVGTNNIPGPSGIFERSEWRSGCKAASVKDVLALYQIHLYREHQYLQKNPLRYLSTPERIIEFQKNQDFFILRDQVRRRLYYETNEVGTFQPTLFGAYKMSMRLLPPLRQIKQWRDRRKANAEIMRAVASTVIPESHVPLTDVSPFEPPLRADALTYA